VPDLYKLLGSRIAQLRRRAGLTQEQLAEKTGYSVDFIGLVERGINAPTVERLQDIADVFGVEVWQLFKPNARLKRESRKSK
jgi:transcriptional regulator with XRE-family HTH domain